MEYKPYNTGRTTYYCAVHRAHLEKDQDCQLCTSPDHQAQVTATLEADWMLREQAFFLKHKFPLRPRRPVDPKTKPNFTNPWCRSYAYLDPKDKSDSSVTSYYSRSERSKNTDPPASRGKSGVARSLAQREKILSVDGDWHELDRSRLEEICGLMPRESSESLQRRR